MKRIKTILAVSSLVLVFFSQLVSAQEPIDIPESACDNQSLTCAVSIGWSWTAPVVREDGSALDASDIASYEVKWGSDVQPILAGCQSSQCVTVDGTTTEAETAVNLPFARDDILDDRQAKFYGELRVIDSLGLVSQPAMIASDWRFPDSFVAALTSRPGAVINVIITVTNAP